MNAFVLETESFWEFVRRFVVMCSNLWQWLNVPIRDWAVYGFLPDIYWDILDRILSISWITPLGILTMTGIAVVVAFRLIHLVNPAS